MGASFGRLLAKVLRVSVVGLAGTVVLVLLDVALLGDRRRTPPR
jgi:hypothetical protein